jgi:hypothetical protein
MKFLKFFLHRRRPSILLRQAETKPVSSAMAAPVQSGGGSPQADPSGSVTSVYEVVGKALEQATEEKKKTRTAVQRILDIVAPPANTTKR